MSTTVTFNGTSYTIPASGELNWSSLSTFLVALGTSAATSVTQKQAIRVATTSPITVVDTTDFAILSNLGTPGAVAVTLPAGVQGRLFAIMDGKGDAATNNITITPNGAETVNGAATFVLNHAGQMVLIQFIGGDWKVLINSVKPGTIVDADIIAAAGIARSKIASGTAYRVLANTSTGAMGENAALTATHVIYADANGQLAGEATLAKSRGGAGADQSSVTYPSTGTIATIAGAQVITNKDIDGGTASDTLRLTVPKNTKTNLDGLTRKEATLVYASDTDKLYVDDGSVLKAVGSGTGQGELNYVSNPSGSDNVAAAVPTGWANVGDLDIVVTKTTGELPRENLTVSGLKITADANTQSAADYVYFDFTLDDVDLNRILKIQWDQKVLATYAAGQLAVVITTQADRATAIATPSVTAIPAQDGTFGATFLSGSTATLSLVIRATADMTQDDGIVISNVIVGPGQLVQGAAVGDWTSFTPTVSGVTGGTPTILGQYRRVGDTMHARVKVTWGTIFTGGSEAKIVLPAGFTINATKMTSPDAAGNAVVGSGTLRDSGTASYDATVAYTDSTTLVINPIQADGTYSKGAIVTTTVPFTWANNDQWYAEFTIPITEWSSGVYLGSGADGTSLLNWTAASTEVGLKYGASAATNITSYTTKVRRVGDSLDFVTEIVFNGAANANGNINLTIPNGLTIDAAKAPAGSRLYPVKFATNSKQYFGLARVKDTTQLEILRVDDAGVTSAFWAGNTSAGSNLPSGAAIANTDYITYSVFGLPISGWTAQDYLGKMLLGFSSASSTRPGLVKVSDGAYTVTNVTPDRSYNADSTSDAEIADVLGTLISDLQLAGIIK